MKISAYTLAAVLIFAALIISPVVGGIAGWVFSIVFFESFARLQDILGTGASGFEIGAIIGFIGSLVRAPSAPKMPNGLK